MPPCRPAPPCRWHCDHQRQRLCQWPAESHQSQRPARSSRSGAGAGAQPPPWHQTSSCPALAAARQIPRSRSRSWPPSPPWSTSQPESTRHWSSHGYRWPAARQPRPAAQPASRTAVRSSFHKAQPDTGTQTKSRSHTAWVPGRPTGALAATHRSTRRQCQVASS